MMLEDLENECREMVRRGFELLANDRSSLDPASLDVECATDCPLGQLYGSFDQGLVVLFTCDGMYDERQALREAMRYGFYVPLDATNYYSRYALLTRIWREMLETEECLSEQDKILEKLLGPVGSF